LPATVGGERSQIGDDNGIDGWWNGVAPVRSFKQRARSNPKADLPHLWELPRLIRISGCKKPMRRSRSSAASHRFHLCDIRSKPCCAPDRDSAADARASSSVPQSAAQDSPGGLLGMLASAFGDDPLNPASTRAGSGS